MIRALLIDVVAILLYVYISGRIMWTESEPKWLFLASWTGTVIFLVIVLLNHSPLFQRLDSRMFAALLNNAASLALTGIIYIVTWIVLYGIVVDMKEHAF